MLTDGGVYDNMGDEWEYGYPERAVESAILPPSGAANFLVVANAGKDIGWQSLGRAGLLWRELRGLKRDVDVVYDVSTSQRRRTLLRLFREAEQAGVGLVGVIAHMPTTPLDVCAAFTGQADRGARADETRIVLNNMHEHWSALASSNADVPTTLGALSVETTVDLVLHAAALVTVSGYVVHGLGDRPAPDPGRGPGLGRGRRGRRGGLEAQDRLDAVAERLEPLAAAERGELEQERHADDGGGRRTPTPGSARGGGGAAGGEHVVDDEHAVVGFERVAVHLERVGAVLELVAVRVRVPRQLARLAHGHEAGTERERDRRREDEPARLDADDLGDRPRRTAPPGARSRRGTRRRRRAAA